MLCCVTGCTVSSVPKDHTACCVTGCTVPSVPKDHTACCVTGCTVLSVPKDHTACCVTGCTDPRYQRIKLLAVSLGVQFPGTKGSYCLLCHINFLSYILLVLTFCIDMYFATPKDWYLSPTIQKWTCNCNFISVHFNGLKITTQWLNRAAA